MAVNKDLMLYMIESRLSKKPAITQHRAQADGGDITEKRGI
jgi:hypothetical protein